MKIDIV